MPQGPFESQVVLVKDGKEMLSHPVDARQHMKHGWEMKSAPGNIIKEALAPEGGVVEEIKKKPESNGKPEGDASIAVPEPVADTKKTPAAKKK